MVEKTAINSSENSAEARAKKRSRGARNLLLMGLSSIAIALITTSVSMAIYHNSGDIYLDRSRPGYLPDKEEIENDNKDGEEEEYDFGKNGSLTKEGLDEYLQNLEETVKDIEAFERPFDGKMLSDENLGIKATSDTGSASGGEANAGQ